jgi:endonuclease/exonuclease/phosphatase (EEP) superfamily protein YafD
MMKQWWSFSRRNIWLVLGGLFSLFTLLGQLGHWSWLLDLLSHFQPYYLGGLVLCLGLGMVWRPSRPWLNLLLLPALLYNITLFAPFYIGTAAASLPETPPLQVASLNIYAGNNDYSAVVAYIRQHQPHFVFLSEAQPSLMAYLASHLAEEYPYVYDESTQGTTGLAFISQIPLVSAETIPYASGRRRRLITATIVWQEQRVDIYGIHPYPPLGGRMAEMRNSEITAVADWLQRPSNPTILLGDFNATPWSAPMRHLTQTTPLHYASLGFGLNPTWHTGSWLIHVPIDHVLLSPDWQTSQFLTEGDIGSDHRPIYTKLHLLP